jgi:hypothetical protein
MSTTTGSKHKNLKNVDKNREGKGTLTECSQVEVLVAGDAADARLPTPVLVVPAANAIISSVNFPQRCICLSVATLIESCKPSYDSSARTW